MFCNGTLRKIIIGTVGGFLFVALILLAAVSLFGQNELTKEFLITDELDRIKIQTQLILEENAELRRQLAVANQKTVREGGTLLIRQIATKHGVPEPYEFKVTESGEMKFLFKPLSQ